MPIYVRPVERAMGMSTCPFVKRLQMKKKTVFPIILRLNEDVVDAIDAARHSLRMDRTTWLRVAVQRNLKHNLEHDLPLVESREIQSALRP